MKGSTLSISTLTATAIGYSTLTGSSMTSNTLALSTLTVSSINNGAPGVAAYSTLNVSTLNATSSITASTITTTNPVGVGTANPVGNFHVYAAAGPYINLGTAAYLSSLTMGIAAGNGNFSNSAVLNDVVIRATSVSSNLMLQTGSGAAAIYINSSNNVGIGTAAPAYTLDVSSGTVGIFNRLLGNSNNASTDKFWIGLRGTGTEVQRLCLGISGDPTTGIVSSITAGINGGIGWFINSSNNVGIGTVSPYANVQIYNTNAAGSGYGSLLVDSPNYGSAGGCITIRNSAGGNNAFCSLTFEVDGSTSCISGSTPSAFNQANAMIYCQNVGSGNNAGKLGFQLWNGSAEFETMSLLPTGNILLNGASSYCTGINMPVGGFGLTWGVGYTRIYDDGDIRICTDDTMHFYTGCSTTSPGTEVMTISNIAYVGVGTSAPSAPFHIYKSMIQSYPSISNIDVQLGMTTPDGGRWYIGQDRSTNANLYFIANVNTNSFTTLDICGYVENDTAAERLMNFTGQHRCAYDDTIHYSVSEGLIVRATGTYWSLIDTYENSSQIDHITINESLPEITLVREANCPAVFGAVSFTEDTNNTRIGSAGRFTSVYGNPFGEKQRVFVNALGEGGVWVCNINGNFSIGDLITTSTVPGYGMRQSTNQIMNYTFGKITMNCDFQPTLLPVLSARTKQVSTTTMEPQFEEQTVEETTTEIVYDNVTQRYVQKTIVSQTIQQVPVNDQFPLYDDAGNVIGNHTVQRQVAKTTVSTVNDLDANGNVQWDPSLDANGVPLTKPAYQLRYLDSNGTILTVDQYYTLIQNGQPAYLAAFVGCIYQCG